MLPIFILFLLIIVPQAIGAALMEKYLIDNNIELDGQHWIKILNQYSNQKRKEQKFPSLVIVFLSPIVVVPLTYAMFYIW